MKNDNSVQFWYNWYMNYYKDFYSNLQGEGKTEKEKNFLFREKLEKMLKEHKENYNNRTDKNNLDYTIQDSIRGQKNQIEVLELILKRMNNGYFTFKKYEVKADNIADFLKRFTKYDRHEGRGQDYAESRIKSHTEEFNKYGYCMMSHHESVTGEVVSYYGNK